MAERSSKFLHYWVMLIKGAHLLAEISQTTGKEKNVYSCPASWQISLFREHSALSVACWYLLN